MYFGVQLLRSLAMFTWRENDCPFGEEEEEVYDKMVNLPVMGYDFS